MKTEHELNDAILKITMTIREKYPELAKYMAEMPVTIPDVITPEINIRTLTEYYDSLEAILKKYRQSHF